MTPMVVAMVVSLILAGPFWVAVAKAPEAWEFLRGFVSGLIALVGVVVTM